MTDVSDFASNISSFTLDVGQHATDFVKDNWVWSKCPWDWWNHIAWNSCALVNDDPLAHCADQAGFHPGELDSFLFTGENPDSNIAARKSVCYPLDVTGQVTDEKSF